jgi:4a-hydroxytetrahydrobiopterin dehydratase
MTLAASDGCRRLCLRACWTPAEVPEGIRTSGVVAQKTKKEGDEERHDHDQPIVLGFMSRRRSYKLKLSPGVMIMAVLTSEKCTACRRDSPRVSEAELEELKPQVPDWTLVERDGIPRLERGFRFPNFAEALSFTNQVGALAEEEGHHPAILTEWGRVTVTLWTHKIHGLHRNDLVMAAKIDAFVAAP